MENMFKTHKNEYSDSIRNVPAVKLVDFIIKKAVDINASDIHIEPFEEYVKIRYRIDGQLKEFIRYPKGTLNSIISRIKVLANMDIAEKRLPQDGRVILKIEDKEYDFRISTLATVHGEKAVIRILRKENILLGKKHLGIQDDDIEKLECILRNQNGIVFVTGPTGSGKTTTLYTLMEEVNKGDKNIITIEDPVEYMIEGINQININLKTGITFASGLRTILRQDPDIIMIGEIRDCETAEIAIRAAITGHLVFSTLHTYDSASAIIRLIDMGIEPYLVAASVTGIISQRLIKKICPYCKEEYKANRFEKQVMNMEGQDNIRLFKGKGCEKCSGTGYKGRTGVFEIMEISKEHREIIMSDRNIDILKDFCVKNGLKTLKDSCRKLVLDGITTINEYIRIAYLKV